jgi:16S rRNA (guanine527-N7)-methyltransferase
VKRVDELATQYNLDPEATHGLVGLLELLYTDSHAPTTVREPGRAADVHLADSLAGLELPAIRQATTLADLGSGAGFPGLPLALALRGTQVQLVESNGRKCDFLERAVAASGADNARVVRARVEEWNEGRGACDVVTARALAPWR